MPMIKITQGGITTEVSKGELDWYKRNGWVVVEEKPAEPAPIDEPKESEPAPAKKKASKE